MCLPKNRNFDAEDYGLPLIGQSGYRINIEANPVDIADEIGHGPHVIFYDIPKCEHINLTALNYYWNNKLAFVDLYCCSIVKTKLSNLCSLFRQRDTQGNALWQYATKRMSSASLCRLACCVENQFC